MGKGGKESRVGRYLKAPIRFLCKARDLYVQSLTECAGRFECGSVMGCPAPQIYTLPRSFSFGSARSGDDDLRELIRAASIRSTPGNRVDVELLRQRQSPLRGAKVVPRSFSVGIGRIDEDEPCEFPEDVKAKTDVFPRSRSCAVTKKANMF